MILATALLLSHLFKPGPAVVYTVTIDPADTTSIQVAMVIQAAPTPETRIAMAVHPEYNDRFWRYIRALRAEVDGEPVTITTLSDHSWRVPTPIGKHRTTIAYRIQLPAETTNNRAVWHTTVRRNGASINSTDTFLYLPDYPRSIVSLALRAPDAWQIRSGLSCTFREISAGTRYCGTDSGSTAVDATTLLDSPILLGDLHTWSFAVQGVPHEVVYWPLPNSTRFDTTEFVDGIERYAREAFAVFGRAPYNKYTFLIEDGGWGGLEHRSSVSIGARSGELAKDPRALMGEIAHEYFHTWNLMALNPRGVLVASADTPAHTRELWWSEGVTMYYAETLQRRAGIPEDGNTRLFALQDQLDRFYADSGNSYVSPERGSWVSIDPPTSATGDYLSNYYTQGRLIAYALDRIIFDSTAGRKGMDDVMRLMYDRYAGKAAFRGADIERAVQDVCQCDIHQFFEDHVRSARPIDFNPLLAPLGLRVVLSTEPVADNDVPRPDLRMLAYVPADGGRLRVRIMDPRTVWSRAGVHTGMELVSLNGVAIDSFPDFRRAIRSIRLDDVVPIEVVSAGARRKLDVRVTGYSRTRARIVESEPIDPVRRRLRTRWLAAR